MSTLMRNKWLLLPLVLLLVVTTAALASAAIPDESVRFAPDAPAAVGSIAIEKVTYGGQGTFGFSFNDTAPPWTPSITTAAAGAPAGASGYGNAGPKVVDVAGTYRLQETSYANGWMPFDVKCDDPTAVVNLSWTSPTGPGPYVDITWAPNVIKNVKCVFYNTIPAGISIQKFVNNPPDAGVKFPFVLSGAKSWTVSIAQADGAVANNQLPPGDYNLTEDLSALPQWRLDDLLCKTAPGGVTVDPAAFTLAAADRVVCEAQNKRLGEIRVEKRAAPADGTKFDITVTGPDMIPPDGPLPKTFNLANSEKGSVWVLVGTGYGVAETAKPADWDLTNLVCFDINNQPITDPANFAVVASDPTVGRPAAECFFVNEKRGSITIEKTALGGDDTFGFTTSGGHLDTPLPAAFAMSTSGGTVSQTFPSLKPGQYTVTEDDPHALPWMYDLTGLSCVDSTGVTASTWDQATRTATINLDPSENVTCTFTDTKRAKVVIDKVTTPGNLTDLFTFTPSFGPPPFDLADTTAPATYFVPPGTHTVVETVPSNFVLNSVDCVDPNGDSTGDVAAAKATINAGAGELITCTFGNWQKGQVIIEKESIGGTDIFGFAGSAGIGGFSIDTTGANPNTATSALLDPGVHTVAETAKDGWDLTFLDCDDDNSANPSTGVIDPLGGSGTGGTATINLDPGETVTCTFVDTKRGDITSSKLSVGGTGVFPFMLTRPDGTTASWNFDTTGGNPASGNYGYAPLGTWVYQETVPAGWTLQDIVCTESVSSAGFVKDLANGKVTFVLDPGESVDCQWINHKWGKIVVDKQVQSSNPADNDVEFLLRATWGDFLMAGSTPNAEKEVPPDVAFSITEDMLTGWMADSYNTYCEPYDNVPGNQATTAVMVAPGQTVNCYFTNRKLAWISLEKRVTPAAETQSFNFTTTYAGDINLTGQDAPVGQWVTPGADLSITENLTDPEWYLDAFNCVPVYTSAVSRAGMTVTVNPVAGDTIACYYSNIKMAHITLDKIAVSVDPADQDVKFDFRAHLPAEVLFQWAASDGVWDSGPVKPYNLLNTVDLMELNIPAGWVLDSAVCTHEDGRTDDPQGDWIHDIKPGEIIDCVFTNTKLGQIIIEKESVGGTGSFDFQAAGIGTFAIDTAVANPNTMTLPPLVPPGAYIGSELVENGWDLTGLSCDDANSLTPSTWAIDPVGTNGTGGSVTVNLDPGEIVKCTFVNTKRGDITSSKLSRGGPGVFPFTLTRPDGTTAAWNFDTNVANPASGNYALAPLGTWVYQETIPTGWKLEDIVCTESVSTVGSVKDLATGKMTFVLDPGESVNCQWINDGRATIIVDKVTAPADNVVNFAFTTTGTGYAGPFTLTDVQAPNEQQVSFGGTYTVEETAPAAPWDFNKLECVVVSDPLGGSTATALKTTLPATATIQPNVGAVIRCTFVNWKRGNIVIDKETDPHIWNSKLSMYPFQFTHNIPAPSTAFTLNDNWLLMAPGQLWGVRNVKPGTYWVSEASGLPIGALTAINCTDANSSGTINPGGWGGTANIVLDPGETVRCTFVNTNAKPTGIVSNNVQDRTTLKVKGGLPIGSFVGAFNTIDPFWDTFIYKLVPGVGSTDNTRFMITQNGRLMTRQVFTAPATYSIRVRSTDSNGLWVEQVFTVYVVP